MDAKSYKFCNNTNADSRRDISDLSMSPGKLAVIIPKMLLNRELKLEQ